MDERKEGDMRECFYSKYLKPHTDMLIVVHYNKKVEVHIEYMENVGIL